MPLLTAVVATTAHAVPAGSLVALCGVEVEGTTPDVFPAGARSLCRLCSREAASASSTAPLRAPGGRKRPGGM